MTDILMPVDLAGKKILVTGATGFIGGRLVERLVSEFGADVRVLLRNFTSGFRIARYPIRMIYGDVTRPDDVARAVADCDYVIHCAYGNSGSSQLKRQINVDGTRNVLEAARQAGNKRVVHVSTVQVYGVLGDGVFDENTPRKYAGDAYSDSKLDAENLATDFAATHGLPLCIIEPTVVYGPFATTWSSAILESMKTTRQILVDGGDGLCNAVYVDDLVSAIVLATVRNEAVGERFLISGNQPVRWGDYFGSFEKMLGEPATINMSIAEADAASAKRSIPKRHMFGETIRILRHDRTTRKRLTSTVEGQFLYRTLARMISKPAMQALKQRAIPVSSGDPSDRPKQKPIKPLFDPLNARFFAARTAISIDKAKRLLGYEPQFDLARGMAATEQWCRWANLIEPPK